MDSGCSSTIVVARLCRSWHGACRIVTADGSGVDCCGKTVLKLKIEGNVLPSVSCLVMEKLVDRVDVIVGMDIINSTGGVVIRPNHHVQFLRDSCVAAASPVGWG